MRRTGRSLCAGICLIVFLVWCVHTEGGRPRANAQEPTPRPVELKEAKYGELCEAIRGHRGKIVVVDIWGYFCVPCKAEFPHLVELHHKYGARGVVCISVSVDQPKQRDLALGFLTEKKAEFPNYWLNEAIPYWQDRFNINGPPAVFVFDRDGRRAGKFDGNDPDRSYTYKDVEALVQELLKSSP